MFTSVCVSEWLLANDGSHGNLGGPNWVVLEGRKKNETCRGQNSLMDCFTEQKAVLYLALIDATKTLRSRQPRHQQPLAPPKPNSKAVHTGSASPS